MQPEPKRKTDTGTQEETRPRENNALCQKEKKLMVFGCLMCKNRKALNSVIICVLSGYQRTELHMQLKLTVLRKMWSLFITLY